MLLNYRVFILGSPGKSRRALVRMAEGLGCQVVGSGGVEKLAQFHDRALSVELLLIDRPLGLSTGSGFRVGKAQDRHTTSDPAGLN